MIYLWSSDYCKFKNAMSPFLITRNFGDFLFQFPTFPPLSPQTLGWQTPSTPAQLRGCLHDTGATFAPERVHSGSLSWLYICLHDTTTNFMLARVTPARVHPGSRTGARISLRYEISQRYHVKNNPVIM